MGIARTKITGLTEYLPSACCNGFTLYAPMDGKKVYLIDMMGRPVNQWDMPLTPGCDYRLLKNGNLLYAGKGKNPPLEKMEGSGGLLLEVDWDGKEVWKFEDEYLHHSFYRLDNGNTLALKWVKVPADVASKIGGGVEETEPDVNKNPDETWGDAIIEIDPQGKVVWQWNAHEHLDGKIDTVCPFCKKTEWTHATSLDVFANGDILICMPRINSVLIIDHKTGDIKWRFGPGELGHPNGAIVLDDDNILIMDNGFHAPPLGMGFSRLLEVNVSSTTMTWQYKEKIPFDFYSSVCGNVQFLPNENYLVCEGTTGRIFEVARDGQLVWEFTSSDKNDSTIGWGKGHSYVYAAYRYDFRHEAIADEPVKNALAKQKAAAGDEVKPVAKKPAPKQSAEDAVRSRLADLGY